MLTNCFSFAPRDSVPGIITKICKYLKAHPGWSVEELKEAVDDIVADLGVSDVSYFTSKSISDLNINDLYNAGYRFVFIGVQGAYTSMYALEKSDESVIANGVFLGGDGETLPSYPVTSVNGDTGAVKTLRVDPNDPGIPTDTPVPINATTLDGKSSSYYVSVETVNKFLEKKAGVIIDTSVRAASHELYAQDGDMKVTLYGKTTETGTGDKSPDNPYVISGVDAANMGASGKNLLPISNRATTATCINNHDGSYTFVGEASGAREYPLFGNYGNYVDIPSIGIGTRTLSAPGLHPKDRIIVYVASVDGTIISYGAPSGGSVTFEVKSGDRFFIMFFSGEDRSYSNNRVFPMLQAGNLATPYEPYNANVITPLLLPDGSPLMGNGTVDDTVENDVLSGCDVKVVFDGSDDEGWWMDAAGVFKRVGAIHPYSDSQYQYSNGIPFAGTHASANPRFKITGDGAVYIVNSAYSDVSELKAALAANPLTVYYRSTEYTPDKDLRVCKTVRRWTSFTLDGNSQLLADTDRPGVYSHFMRGYDASVLPIVDGLNAKNPTTSNNGANNMNANECAFRTGTADRFYIKMAEQTVDEVHAVLAAHPVTVWYASATAETYMTDPLDLRKPTGIMPVTVTGSGETAVTYPCDTKAYIDRKFDALAAALLS